MPTILTRPALRTHTFSVISTGISFSSYQSQLFQLYNNHTLSLLLNGVLSLTVYFFKFWLYRNIPICMQCFLLSFFFFNFDLLLHVCNILWTYSPWAFPSLLPSHSCLPFYNADPPSLVITSFTHKLMPLLVLHSKIHRSIVSSLFPMFFLFLNLLSHALTSTIPPNLQWASVVATLLVVFVLSPHVHWPVSSVFPILLYHLLCCASCS